MKGAHVSASPGSVPGGVVKETGPDETRSTSSRSRTGGDRSAWRWEIDYDGEIHTAATLFECDPGTRNTGAVRHAYVYQDRLE